MEKKYQTNDIYGLFWQIYISQKLEFFSNSCTMTEKLKRNPRIKSTITP